MYRPEHPNPQSKRSTWQNLNGTWEFDLDLGRSGRDRRLYEGKEPLTRTIEVPFCPESPLSGIAYRDFMAAVWYRRTFSLTQEQLNGTVLLHFGAVDHHAYIYINGKKAGEHVGGYVSFAIDITAYATAGENVLMVCAEDDTRDPMIPCGKQAKVYPSTGCDYTRTTGIWQTVWLEFMPRTHIASFRLYPDAENACLRIDAQVTGAGRFCASASFAGKPMGGAACACEAGYVSLTVPLSERHLWEVGKGGLYDLTLSLGEDTVQSYFGLRSLHYTDKKCFINGRSVFQRLVLDQGFYPDGIYTAPTEEALIEDIRLSMAVGFNGARLHEKIFEPLFLYHADRLGYIVWGEYPNWGLDHEHPHAIHAILPEWLEEVERDFNHPSIVGWCPFNETWGHPDFALMKTVYLATKAADPTRPCIDTSGNYHTALTDIYDTHDYDQNPETFSEHYRALEETGVLYDPVNEGKATWTSGKAEALYNGKVPVFISEYGGIRWSEDPSGWGYGNAPKTEEEFKARFKGLTDVLLDNRCIFGLCYTQLYDIEQEQNGLYYYDRRPKFDDMEFFHTVLSRTAEIEK